MIAVPRSRHVVESDSNVIVERLGAGRIRTVLAVRASRLGDLLMTTPALHAFRQRWPDPRILFLTNTYSAKLLHGNEDIDELVTFKGREPELGRRKGKALASRLRPRQIDLLLALRPRKELVTFADRAGIANLWPPPSAQYDVEVGHVVERCLSRLLPLGLTGTPGPLRIHVDPEARDRTREMLPAGSGPVLLAHPGCDETIRWKPRRGVRRRIWPVSHWRACLGAMAEAGWRVVLSSGSRVESQWVERIRDGLEATTTHVRQLALDDYAALVDLADVMVTVDTGPLHVASAVGTPLIGLYGPSPTASTGPWKGTAEVLRHDLPCAPCQGKGVVCYRNVCMEAIRPEQVIAACRRMLAVVQA